MKEYYGHIYMFLCPDGKLTTFRYSQPNDTLIEKNTTKYTTMFKRIL
jgi:hypothetical protein